MSLVTGMLEYNPDRRLSAKDVLEHPWFTNQKQTAVDKEVVQNRLNNLMNFRAN